ncbi:MAG: efflux RND transporter permease subunit [Prevotellaceae bacterium]|jgi:multidrug efflux pump subunit AcrB|nr:efflux RND transporter permease subunit [Prevotellaceae bacterium]
MKRNITGIAMRYSKIMLLIVVLLVGLGVFGLIKMSKQEFPPFTIRQGLIAGVYPGATSAEVEEQLAKPLEQFLFTYKEIKKDKTCSMSQNGMVFIMVELNDNVNNKDEVWSKIKHGLTNFKSQLPSGVIAVIANDDFGDTSALLVALESSDKTYRELETYLDKLEAKLRQIESVSNLRRYGLQKEKINVYLDRDKMAVYGIKYNFLTTNLFTQTLTTAGGTITCNGQDFPIHFAKTFSTEKQIADQIIYSDTDGNTIRLRDIANIVREYDTPDSYITNNGKTAIILSMEMTEGNNIIAYGKDIDKALAEFQKELPESVAVKRIADQPKIVADSVYSFVRDLFISIIVVILVMMILFPFRSAVVAATSIPTGIFISIGIMFVVGIPLNTVTLAALIVVLGMIVDNSIIVVDAYLENLDKNMSRWHAAILSAKNYFGSILLATLCICTIFFPLLFIMKGLFLDFLRDFPWTLTISLMTSLIVAMIFIPFLEYVLIKKGLRTRQKNQKKKSFNTLNLVQRIYNKTLDITFKFPYVTIFIGISTIIISVVIMSNFSIRMMPVADRNQFAVEIYLPQGSSLQTTEKIADSMRNILSTDVRIKSITAFTGMASPRFQASYTPNLPSKHYAQFIVNTASIQATRDILDDYTNKYADYFPNAYVKFKQLDYQNVSNPVEVRLAGDEIPMLKQYADTLVHKLQKIEGLVWLHTNYEEMLPVIEVKLEPVESARLGVSKTLAAANLAMNYDEISAGTMWENDYPLAVVLKSNKKTPQTLDNIGDEYISTAIPGVSVQLQQIAEIKPAWSQGQIVRRNGMRTVSIIADIARGYSQSKMIEKIKKIVETQIKQTLPDNITVSMGGVVENDRQVVPPIISSLSVSVILIFFFLLFNFKKISLAATALLSILLCLLGAATGLLIFNLEFGLTCVLGIISLMGIIVRNAIIMFEHAENLRKRHHATARDAIYDAGKRRMLPIFLTSATTAVGVIPMIISNSSLWTPMGVIICFGALVAMILVVTILPVVYWKIYGNK